MPIHSLNDPNGLPLDTADIAIVGAGACGLTLGRALSGCGLTVVILESGGLEESPAYEALNAVELAESAFQPAEAALRDRYHRTLTKFWDGAAQPYGVRCRGLGGSTQAWAGKSAPFEPIDLAPRDWVALSGWPVSADILAPYIDQASEFLNLGPQIYDEALWQLMGRRPPEPALDGGAFSTRFWQFARSRHTATDIMRFGDDFRVSPPADVHVLTDATVTRLLSTDNGKECRGLEMTNLSGRRVKLRAQTCVLAAGAIENARLLLLSRDAKPAGLGNDTDCVGRYLMDHPTATVARAIPEQISDMAARFGLFGLRGEKSTHVYMHGLVLSEVQQIAEKSLNGAVFVTEERAPDDPFSALGRLIRRRSTAPLSDLLSVARSPVRLLRGVGARTLERGYLPAPLTRLTIDVALRFFPNAVARDYRFGKLPLKLAGLRFEATTEQPPLAENRITLSENCDPLGLPLAHVAWTSGEAARANLLRIGVRLGESFRDAGLPPLQLEPWVEEKRPEAAIAIDLGHSMGSTRMSTDPRTGVVDAECAVHGVKNLFVAGGSVLPTSGHANPTLMMLALSLRLADLLRKKFA